MLDLTQTEQGLRLSVKVVPGASRSRIVGLLGPALKVQIAAAPEKGKANRELQKLLGQCLGLPPASIFIMKGQTLPFKELLITDVTAEQLRQTLEPYFAAKD